MELESAVSFVRKHGSPVEQARLEYLLGGLSPSSEVASSLIAGQREDGGWPPFWAPDISSLDATCFRLAQAEALGLIPAGSAPHATAVRAAGFLARRQGSDGSFEEEASQAAAAPAWTAPGDLAARLYLTANCGFWLVELGESQSASHAADHLQAHLGSGGELPSFLQAHWLAAGLWQKLGRNEPARQVCAMLRSRLSELPASSLAWLSVALRISGLPPGQPLLEEASARLVQLQEPDGRWPSEDGPFFDVHTTLEAIRTLHPGKPPDR
jgi:hypothetical protein